MRNIILLFAIICLYSCSSDELSNKQNSQDLNFTDIHNISVDTLDLDMISDISQNSIYLTYSSNNGLNENVLKYNITTQTSTIISHPDVTESRQIEIIGNWIYSISKNDVYRYDLNLGNLSLHNNQTTGLEHTRAVVNSNKISFIEGQNLLFNYDTTSNTYQRNMQGNSYKLRADSEIFNNKIYTFGGCSYDTNHNPILYNTINIYDIASNTWLQDSLPFNVYESFTASYNNTIIVAGNKNSISSDSFIGVFNPITNNYTTLTSTLDLSNISIRGITILNQNIYLAYTDLTTPMPLLMNVKIAKATLP